MSYPLRAQYHNLRKAIGRGLDSFWPSIPLDEIAETLHRDTRPPYDFGLPDPLPAQARDFLQGWRTRSDLEAIYRLTVPCTIDPKMGIIFAGKRVVWGSSDQPGRERNPRYFSHLKRPHRRLKQAISLHHIHGDNYCHFYLYVVNRALASQKADLPPDIPFLVGEVTARTSAFRQAVDLGLFGEREVIVQSRKEVIGVDECFLVRGFAMHTPYFDEICLRLGLDPEPDDGPPLLLTRDQTAANARLYRNQAELNNLVSTFGFESVDPGQLPLLEQARLFSRTPMIVSPHGAGLINLIFRQKKPCHLVELFNPDMGSGHYYQIARARGFDYTSQMTLKPEGRNFTASTEVDLVALRSVFASGYRSVTDSP